MSVPKRRLSLTAGARRDVRAALLFSQQRWGHEQRTRYERRIRAAMDHLLDHPELGVSRPDIFDACRSLAVEQHVVYYRATETHVVISRVLHARQDPVGKVTR